MELLIRTEKLQYAKMCQYLTIPCETNLVRDVSAYYGTNLINVYGRNYYRNNVLFIVYTLQLYEKIIQLGTELDFQSNISFLDSVNKLYMFLLTVPFFSYVYKFVETVISSFIKFVVIIMHLKATQSLCILIPFSALSG